MSSKVTLMTQCRLTIHFEKSDSNTIRLTTQLMESKTVSFFCYGHFATWSKE